VRPFAAVGVAALALAAATACGGGGSSSTTDITELVGQATTKIRSSPEFKDAVLLEADGTPTSGTVTTADGITRWRIVFQNQTTKGSKYRSVFINATDGKLGEPVGNTQPFLEDVDINTVPSMTLADAVEKLRAAGHKEPFGAVTLRFPLGPGFDQPLYIFGFGSGEFWAVETKTGEVKSLS
jgi:hypothetical protein